MSKHTSILLTDEAINKLNEYKAEHNISMNKACNELIIKGYESTKAINKEQEETNKSMEELKKGMRKLKEYMGIIQGNIIKISDKLENFTNK